MKKVLLIAMLAEVVVAQQLPVFHTSGRFLLDPCGDTVIIRGVELPVNHREYIPEVARTGANFVRILVNIPPADYPTSTADLDSMLALTRRAGMAADVSLNNGAGDGSSFTDAAYMPVLKKYEDILTLHAQGEGQQSTVDEWLGDAKAAITRIRNAGYRCPLYILSSTSGRDPFPVLRNGRQLVDFDPRHNILCGVQLYWGYTSAGARGWYINDYDMTDKEAIDSFALKDFPIVAGINNHDPYGDPWLDYETQLSECQAKKISWFWWDWYNPWDGSGKYHISTTGKYGDWGVVAAGAPDMDKFTISGGGSSTTYEAESFTAIAGVGWGTISHSSVSGGVFLCCSGKRIPDWAEWNSVAGGSGGQRTLTITYSNGDKTFPQPLKVVLNGDTVGSLSCGYSGDGANDANFWRVWRDESITVSLRSGVNTLRLVSTATSGHFSPYYGERTVVSHPASIQNTSRRTAYMTAHACGVTAVAMDRGCSSIQPEETRTTAAEDRMARLFPQGSFGLSVHDLAGRTVLLVVPVTRMQARELLRGMPRGTYVLTTTVDGHMSGRSVWAR